MDAKRKLDAVGDGIEVDGKLAPQEEMPTRRHRAASEIRFAKSTPTVPFEPLPPSRIPRRSLTEELRADLWEAVYAALFGLEDHLRPSRPTLGLSLVGGRDRPKPTHAPSSALRRVWASAPIGGIADRIPEDVATVLESWFLLVEPADVYAFIEAVHESLETSLQPRFAIAINAGLERGFSDHRFVMRQLMPITSKSDIAAIDRALAACKAARWIKVETHMLAALTQLANKPEPDARGAIQAAARAVQQAALALTKEHYLDLEDALLDLESKGHIERALRAAYSGLFDYVSNTTRKATTDDARLIVVMCAGFISHLVARLGSSA